MPKGFASIQKSIPIKVIPRVTIVANKGGTGKTSTGLNFAAVLTSLSAGEEGVDVLICDMDPQCNASQVVIEMRLREMYPFLTSDEITELSGRVATRIIAEKGKPLTHASIKLLTEHQSPEALEEQIESYKSLNKTTLLFHPVEVEEDESDHLHLTCIEHSNIVRTDMGAVDDFFDEARWLEITEGDEPTYEECNQLCAHSCLSLANDESSIEDQVLLTLLKKPVVFLAREQIDSFKDWDEGFIITESEDGQTWEVIHRLPSGDYTLAKEELDQIVGLDEILNSIGDTPFQDIGLNIIEKIAGLFVSSFGHRNLLEGFDPEKCISKNPTKTLIQQRARATNIITVRPHGKSGGRIHLLPGSYYLQLVLGSKFSFGIKALNDGLDSVVAPFEAGIYAFNEFLRSVAEYRGVDISICDINPGSHDLNAVAAMTGDGIITVLNPEAYGHHAMRTLGVVLRAWEGQFRSMYQKNEDHPAGRRVVKPPCHLGYSLQKVPKSGKTILGTSERIATVIKRIFSREVMPVIEEIGMAPSWGIPYSDDETELYADVPRFTQEVLAIQRERGIVATDEHRVMHAIYQRVVGRILGGFFENHPDFSEKLQKLLPKTIDDPVAFEDEFAEVVHKGLTDAANRRYDHACDPVDYAMMQQLVQHLRDSQLSEDGEAGSLFPENPYGAVITNPCLHICEFGEIDLGPSRIIENVRAAMQTIYGEWTDPQSLRLLVIPVFTGSRWMNARVEVNLSNTRLSFLFDDPQGAILDKKFQPPTKKKSNVPVLEKSLRDTLVKAVSEEIKLLLPRGKEIGLVSYLTKSTDQQGRFMSHAQSGPITFSNMRDGLTPQEGSLPRNITIDGAYHAADVQRIVDANAMDKWVRIEMPEAVERTKLTCPPFEPPKKSKSYGDSSSLMKLRCEINRIASDTRAARIALQDAPQQKQANKALKEFVRSELSRVLDQYHSLLEGYHKGKSYRSILTMLAGFRRRVFNPGNRSRLNDFESGDPFSKHVIEAWLKANDLYSSRKGSSFMRSSTSGSSGYGVKVGNAKRTTEFDVVKVPGDGDCGFTAFGITREDAFDLLDDHKQDDKTIELLAPVVRETIMREDFVDFCCEHLSPQDVYDLRVSYQAYVDQGDIDDLLGMVDANIGMFVECYIEYDVRDKRVENGWCHPAILQALACIRKVNLYIWRDEGGELVPHKSDDYDFSCIKSKGSRQNTHLLFVGNNHFDLLIPNANLKSPNAKKHRSTPDGASSGKSKKARQGQGGFVRRSSRLIPGLFSPDTSLNKNQLKRSHEAAEGHENAQQGSPSRRLRFDDSEEEGAIRMTISLGSPGV